MVWLAVAFMAAETGLLAFLIETGTGVPQTLPAYMSRVIIILIALSLVLSLCFVLVCRMYMKEHNRLRFKSNYFEYMAHEMKSPITIIRSCNDALSMQMPGAESKELIEMSTKEADVLGNFVQNILTIQRIDNDNLKPQFAKINIADVVEKAVGQFEGLEGNITVYDDSDDKQLKTFETDENMLLQIIGNLLNNSFKYCTRTPEVEIHIAVGADKATVSVSDNGIGISSDEQKLVFNKFYRTNTKEDEKGSGLGLYINTELARLINGKVFLKHSSPKGSVFVVELYNNKQQS